MNYSFRRISPIGGFTYGSINSIGEDADGFIWFGTVHGLYRYNSVDVQKYVNNPQDSTTIPSNSIRSIFCDSSGRLWIGTSQGLCIYDNTKDQFNTPKFQDNFGNNIRDILEGVDTRIYLLNSSTFGKAAMDLKTMDKIEIKKSGDEDFACAVSDSSGSIWIGGTKGSVWQYQIQSKQVHQFCKIRSESIQRIYAEENRIWIAYHMAGLDCVDLQKNLVAHYGSNPEDVNRINHNRVRDIYKDEFGRIWIATYKGLSIIENGKITHMGPQEISGLPYTSIYKIFRDSKKGIWIGTWSGGLAYQSNFDNQFIHITKDQPGSDSDDEFVSSFAEKADGTILIGSEFGNMNILDRNSNRMVNLPFRTENGAKIENIKSLLFDKKAETLWIGTFLGGLWVKRKNDPVFRHIDYFKDKRMSIYSLALADSGIWIGSLGSGLFFYNPENDKTTQYIRTGDSNSLSHNYIRSIIAAKDKSLWIGTTNGLNHFDPQTGKFKRFLSQPNEKNGLSSSEIFALHQGKSGQIWIGTSGGGLNRYDEQTNIFVSFKMADGLIGNDVYGIQEDEDGMIWVSTDNGISCFNPVNLTFRNFSREAELQGNQFNPGATFITKNGEILFGNTKGVTLFTPEQMKTNPFRPKVKLTSLSINNVPFTIHSPGTPLKRTIQTETELKLSHDENSLTFYFAANNFLLPNKNHFKYRLINYDDKWIEAGNQNYANYTKIPPGDYVFEAVASNNDNLWNNVPTQIKVTISPPFWLAWYAYLFYTCTAFLIVYFVWKGIVERQQFKKELLMERFRHESDAQLQEMKLRFFTNISHEFRTPLTLISSPVNYILEKFNLEPIVKDHLLTMKRNSDRLLRLINQLIDVRRIELGKAVFQAQNTDLIKLCKDVIVCFEMEANDKNIHLSFNPEVSKINVNLDSEKADKIIFNILSNAMKFTPDNGLIVVSVYQMHTKELPVDFVEIGESISGDVVCVEVSDNGPGIPEDEIKSVFDRFDQGKNHKSIGTGIGLHMAHEYIRMHKGNLRVKSKIGEGSAFIVSFPIVQVHDNTSELNMDIQRSYTEVKSQLQNLNHFKNNSITVLIIEDNFELRSYLKNLLSLDYKVITKSNGKQGLETALTILPDLVITDVMMPQMDGFEVCRQLKSNIQSSHIPIILLTALNESDKQIGGLKTGADAYITKPFDEKILLALIENIIHSRAKLREVYSISDNDWAMGMEVMHSDRILLNKTANIVRQHLNDKTFVIDQIAAELGISASSLYRKLKYLTNQSPSEFVRYIRLKSAVMLMDDGITNVDEISYAVGFNSHSYFSCSFKKQFGKTPSDYLNDQKTKKKQS